MLVEDEASGFDNMMMVAILMTKNSAKCLYSAIHIAQFFFFGNFMRQAHTTPGHRRQN
jgi:hypothetical protein